MRIRSLARTIRLRRTLDFLDGAPAGFVFGWAWILLS